MTGKLDDTTPLVGISDDTEAEYSGEERLDDDRNLTHTLLGTLSTDERGRRNPDADGDTSESSQG